MALMCLNYSFAFDTFRLYQVKLVIGDIFINLLLFAQSEVGVVLCSERICDHRMKVNLPAENPAFSNTQFSPRKQLEPGRNFYPVKPDFPREIKWSVS